MAENQGPNIEFPELDFETLEMNGASPIRARPCAPKSADVWKSKASSLELVPNIGPAAGHPNPHIEYTQKVGRGLSSPDVDLRERTGMYMGGQCQWGGVCILVHVIKSNCNTP